jgi:hypothetical protein
MMAAQYAASDRPAARSALQRLRLRAGASHEAAVQASQCNALEVLVDHTTVTVRVDPLGARLAGQLDVRP